MKEIAIYDAKNNLSSLIAAIEATGETVVITRHGKPAAQLGPTHHKPTRAARLAAIQDLTELRAEIASGHPNSQPLSWEALKVLMRDEEG